MKQWILRLLPRSWIGWYGNQKLSRFKNQSAKAVFTEIYGASYWKSDESRSGSGSELRQTETLRKALTPLFRELKIQTLLDIPCGDFHWMQHVDLSGIRYTGADIVDGIIVKNRAQYAENENRRFLILDILTDPLPKCDLVLVRDCFVHFSYADIMKALANIKASGTTYLLTTTFPLHPVNFDIITGNWRALNLQAAPFSLPAPVWIVQEQNSAADSRYRDKSLALWKLAES